MRFGLLLIMGLGICLSYVTASYSYAHDGGPERPTYLGFRYYTHGPIYERLREEFRPEWEKEDEMLRANPVYGVHERDLNGDSIPELIIRFPDYYTECNENGCHNAVVAVTEDKITRLGFFEYAEVDIATTQTNGVTDLLVYDNPMNDFGGTLYKWDSETQQYKKNKE